MAIRESMYFTYDGVDCRDMGVISVNMSNGLQDEHFLPRRTIIEESIRGQDEPLYMGLKYDPLEISLQIAFDGNLNLESALEVAKWLDQSYYKPLVFEGNPLRTYYAIPNGDSKLVHNCMNSGYIDITFRCNSPWSFSPVYELPEMDYSENSENGTIYNINNLGNKTSKPHITVHIVSGDSFTVQNLSNSGQKLEFSGLAVGERIDIDCTRRTIDSDIPLTYRYGKMTDDSKFIELLSGNNNILVKGNIKISFKCQYRFTG